MSICYNLGDVDKYKFYVSAILEFNMAAIQRHLVGPMGFLDP